MKSDSLIAGQPLQGWKQILASPRVWMPAFTLVSFYFLIAAIEPGPIPQYPWLNLYPQTTVLVFALLMIGAAYWAGKRAWMPTLMVNLFSLALGTATVSLWQGLDFSAHGIHADSWFSTAMITKFKYSGGYNDFVYKDLSAFYPSFFHYITGRIAHWTRTESWIAFKYGGYWVSILLPLLSFRLWRKLLPDLLAVLAVAMTVYVCKLSIMFKPYEMISLACFIPWVLVYGLGIGYQEGEKGGEWKWGRLSKRELAEGTLWATLIFLTFYYYFFLLIVLLPIRLLVQSKVWGNFREGLKGTGQAMIILGCTALLTSFYWLPFLVEMGSTGGESLQNRWFQPHMVYLPFAGFPKMEMIFGTLTLIALAVRNALAQAILMVMVALLAFVLIGHLGMYLDIPILHIRLVGLEEYYCYIGMVIGGWVLLKEWGPKIGWLWPMAWPTAVIIWVLVAIGMDFSEEPREEKYITAKQSGLPELAKIREFNALRGKVFLTNRSEVVAVKPIYSFIANNAHFSHPAGQFRERAKFLKLLSASGNSDFVAWMLAYNRYQPVDHIMLDGSFLQVADDDFPNPIGHVFIPIQFRDTVFEGQYFEEYGDFTDIKTCKPVAAEIWQQFTLPEKRIVALFGKEEYAALIRKEMPETEWKALQQELSVRVRDYQSFARVFAYRWGKL